MTDSERFGADDGNLEQPKATPLTPEQSAELATAAAQAGVKIDDLIMALTKMPSEVRDLIVGAKARIASEAEAAAEDAARQAAYNAPEFAGQKAELERLVGVIGTEGVTLGQVAQAVLKGRTAQPRHATFLTRADLKNLCDLKMIDCDDFEAGTDGSARSILLTTLDAYEYQLQTKGGNTLPMIRLPDAEMDFFRPKLQPATFKATEDLDDNTPPEFAGQRKGFQLVLSWLGLKD